MKRFTLSDGRQMPALGLGTWKSGPGEVEAAVTAALDAGYRHLDCAWIYGNEAEIGAALARAFAGGLRREQLWITSKLWNDAHEPAHVQPRLQESLDALGLEYLDLYLIHWPVAHALGKVMPAGPGDQLSLEQVPLAATWSAMLAARDAGLARSVGVSNFSVKKLAALAATGAEAPVVNQVELHPYLQQPALLDYCREQGILLTAYSPLGSRDRAAHLKPQDEPVLLEDPVITQIADARGLSPAQVLIAWAIARGTAVIPKSVNPGRIQQNLAAAAVELTPEERTRIDALDRARRYITGTFWAVPGGPYTLQTLWDS